MNAPKNEVKKALITGAAGFIGYHLCEYLLNQGIAVLGVDNFITGSPQNIQDLLSSFPEHFNFIEADVSSPWTLIDGFQSQKFSHIFHLASPACPRQYQRFPIETMMCNSIGLKNALDFADSIKARVIFSSTSEIYGDPQISPQPESYNGNVNPTGPRSCYNEAKRFGEALLKSHNRVHGTTHGIVRIFNTYGPRMHPEDHRVINNFALAVTNDNSFLVHGDGLQTRSFCYISDLIEGLVLYSQSHLCDPMNLGNAEEVTILDLVQVFQDLWPSPIKVHFDKMPPDDPRQRKPDLKFAHSELSKWTPRIDLRTGVSKLIQWHLKVSQSKNLKVSRNMPISPP